MTKATIEMKLDFPREMREWIERDARRLGMSMAAWIKSACADRLTGAYGSEWVDTNPPS